MLAPLAPRPYDSVEGASGLDERLEDSVARTQEFRGEAIPEVDHELAAQAEERAPPMLRNRPTPLEREEHCRTHESCIAGRGRAHPHALRNESEKGLPMVGVDCSTHGTDQWRTLVTLWTQKMMVIRLTAPGRARQSCVDETHEMCGCSPTSFKARATAKETS